MFFLKRFWNKAMEGEARMFMGLVGVVFFYITWISVYRIQNFLTIMPIDTGIVNQAMWNSLHGSWFHQTLTNDPSNILAIHGLFTFVLLLPFYALAPNGFTLFLLKNLAVIASSLPIYLIARDRLPHPWERLGVCFLYLGSPFLLSFCYIETCPEFFAMWMVTAGYYFYTRQKFAAFMGCAFLAMLTKENFPFLYLAWGVFSLIERRSLKWMVSPMVGGIICLTIQLASQHVIASLDPVHETEKFRRYYGVWGNTLGSAFMGMLSHPVEALAYLTEPTKWLNLFYIAFPFFPFLFLRPKYLVLAASNIAIIFLMGTGSAGIEGTWYHPYKSHHFTETCLFSFIAFIDFLGSIESIRNQKHRIELMAGILIISFLSWIGFTGEVSGYFLDYTGLGDGPHFLLFLAWCICSACGTSMVYWRKITPTRFGASLLVGMACLMAAFRVTSFAKNMLSVESYIFSLTSGVKNRDDIANTVLANVPKDKWLTIPSKYGIVASNRSRVTRYDGDSPISSLGIYSKTEPEYIFLDEKNYGSIFEGNVLSKWNRSYYQSLIADHQHWDIIFFYDGLWLLKRRQPDETGKGKK